MKLAESKPLLLTVTLTNTTRHLEKWRCREGTSPRHLWRSISTMKAKLENVSTDKHASLH